MMEMGALPLKLAGWPWNRMAEEVEEWINSNLDGISNSFTELIQNNAALLGKNVDEYASGAYALVLKLHESVMIPLGVILLTFFFSYALFQIVEQKSHLQEGGHQMILKELVKLVIGILLVVHAMDILYYIFWVAQRVIAVAALTTTGEARFAGIDKLLQLAQNLVADERVGALASLWLITLIIRFFYLIVSVYVSFIVLSRAIELYLYLAVAPIPIAGMLYKEFGQMGQGYVKHMLALALQGLLILLAIVLWQTIAGDVFFKASYDDMWAILLQVILSSVVLIALLGKTGTVAKTVLGVA